MTGNKEKPAPHEQPSVGRAAVNISLYESVQFIIPVMAKQPLSYLETTLPTHNHMIALISAQWPLNSLYSYNKGFSDHNYDPKQKFVVEELKMLLILINAQNFSFEFVLLI